MVCHGELCSKVMAGGELFHFFVTGPDNILILLRHIMTGIGAYFYITWGVWLRHYLNGKQDEYELVWPSLFTSLPVVVRRRKSTAAANGSAKKTI